MKRFIRLAVSAGAVLGLSALVAPLAAGAEGVPQGGPFIGGDAITPSSFRPTTPRATRSSPMTGPTTGA